MKYGNIFYLSSILEIGGIEAWFNYIVREYPDRDITIIARQFNNTQLRRLRKFARCIVWDGKEIFECKNFFCNFNTDLIDYVDADKYYLILHGDYLDMVNRQQLAITNLPKHEKVDEYIAISKLVANSWYELTGIIPRVCYNPFIPPKKSPRPNVMLLSAQRLSREKGGGRIIQLANALDEYCKEHGTEYRWDIYSNDLGIENLKTYGKLSHRIGIHKPTPFVNEIMWQYDFFVSLTDNEGYCYSVVEALSNGTPCIVTPVPVLKEIGVDDTNSITLDFDLSNVDQVVKRIFEKMDRVSYTPVKDNWDEILTEDKKTYEGEEEKMVKIKALYDYKDTYEDMQVRKGQVYETTEERGKLLTTTKVNVIGTDTFYAEYVEEPSNAKVEETPKKRKSNAKRKAD